MNINLYEKFNALTDQQRFDMMYSIKGDVEKGFVSPYGADEYLAIQINTNWGGSWGIDGSDSPHPDMNVIGMLSKIDEEGESVLKFTPFGRRTYTTRVNKNHFFVVKDVQSLDSILQVELGMMSESIDVNRWGKLAGIIKG